MRSIARSEIQPFVDTSAAASVLGISKRTLIRYRKKGNGPPFRKFKGRVLYDLKDLSPVDALLVDTSTAASILGLSKSTLLRFRKQGSGPPYHTFRRRERRVLYDPEELQAWADQHLESAQSIRPDAEA